MSNTYIANQICDQINNLKDATYSSCDYIVKEIRKNAYVDIIFTIATTYLALFFYVMVVVLKFCISAPQLFDTIVGSNDCPLFGKIFFVTLGSTMIMLFIMLALLGGFVVVLSILEGGAVVTVESYKAIKFAIERHWIIEMRKNK